MGGSRAGACLVSLAVMLGSAAAEPTKVAKEKGPRPRLLVPFDAATVRQAVEGATARLGTASCQGLLEEFATPDGTSLKDRLESQGTTLQARLGSLHFFDASGLPACRSARVYAFTQPNLGAVYVCTSRFTAVHRQDPTLAEAVVIHELLHTIGLGEYPPTPEHITARVRDRCHTSEARRVP